MLILYQSAYSTISFDEASSLLEFIYTPETAKMSLEAYKKDVESYFGVVFAKVFSKPSFQRLD